MFIANRLQLVRLYVFTHRQRVTQIDNRQAVLDHQLLTAAINNGKRARYQQFICTISTVLCCISVALATVVGCAAERGTVGAQLGRRDDGRLFIRETPLGLAASKAGLHPGDEITLINGQDVRSFDERGIHGILSGEVGDPVKLTVIRGEQVLHVILQRTPAPRPHKPEK